MLWQLFIGASFVLGLEAVSDCPKVSCLKSTKMQCEAVKGVFLQKSGFCYCCKVSATEGEVGVTCDKKYCDLSVWPWVTKSDCHKDFEVFKKKDVPKCICADQCEPVFIKTLKGDECGKALCAWWNCGFTTPLPTKCQPNEELIKADACRCCNSCKKK